MARKVYLFNYQIASRIYDIIQHYYSEIPYRLFLKGRAFPVWHYYIEVTRRCNLRCKMCMYLEYMTSVPASEQASGEMSSDEWKNVISQTGHMSLITFTGGEPFLRSDFMNILACASAHTRTHVITNATLLDERTIEDLVEMAPKHPNARGLLFLGVSLEGPESIHDSIRGVSGAFNRTMTNLQYLKSLRRSRKLRFPLLHVTSVIQKDNLSVLPEMPQIVKEAGSDILNLVLEYRSMDRWDFDDGSLATIRSADPVIPDLDPEELKRVLEKTEKNARSLDVKLRLPRMPWKQIIDYYAGEFNQADFSCRAPWNTLFVDRIGEVSSCWLFPLGNVKQNSLKELWNGKKMRDLRRSCRQGLFPMCAGCCFLEYRGKCMKKDDRT